MDYTNWTLILAFIFILMLLVLKISTPLIMRSEIFFGVRLPRKLINHEKLKEFKKLYIRNSIFVCGIYVVFLCYMLLTHPSNIVLLIGIIAFFILSTIIYYFSHKKVKEFKKFNQDKTYKKQIVVIDTNFRNNKKQRLLPHRQWFLIPISIVLLNIIIGYLVFDRLPIFVPVHWNASGKIDITTIKSYGVIFEVPLQQIFITIYMFLIYQIIERSKQQISSFRPEYSREINRVFRYRWAANIIFLNVLILIESTITNLFLLEVVNINFKFLVLLKPITVILILLDILIISLWTGQGGSRIKIDDNNIDTNSCDNLDDDKYWKLGLIYFNPKDPALFVEKRFGIAFGLNYGKIRTYVLIIAVIGSIILLNVLEYILLLMYNI
ncbi:Uncharacterized membrane protein [Clostridium acidisoli DSM 12555]|uniref:Uncharacterized membrane protein n=1 Tax=Clostridium acidisoli DSM 12555 TaxID=1121291 RepID=A0A1W1XFL2_9CLOT|nr:DUF1648 domain-containing protein [Clostridium acidisoli]SMC22719.1 Uncharacterized membrane protein [Clostridium acidisoli DSM 12555]